MTSSLSAAMCLVLGVCAAMLTGVMLVGRSIAGIPDWVVMFYMVTMASAIPLLPNRGLEGFRNLLTLPILFVSAGAMEMSGLLEASTVDETAAMVFKVVYWLAGIGMPILTWAYVLLLRKEAANKANP